MATRFYLPSSGASSLPALAFSASWESSTNAVRRPLRRSKTGTFLATTAKAFPSTTTQQMLFGQYVSAPLASAQSVSGSISMVLSCMEADLTADAHLAFLAYVVARDGSNPRTLLEYHAISTEMTTAMQTRIHSARAITTVAAAAGDRIVIEIGAHGDTPATGFNISLRTGDPHAGTDFALTSGLTTDLVPWVELSSTLVFGDPNSAAPPLKDGDLAIVVGGTDATVEATMLRFTSTARGGFGESSWRLPATNPHQGYALGMGRDAEVVITHGAQTLFEGKVTGDQSVGNIDDGVAYYDYAAAGWWYDAGKRKDGLLVLCDTDLEQWEVSKRGQPSRYDADTDGRLQIVAQKGATYNAYGGSNILYWLHKGLGSPDQHIDHLIFVLGDFGDGSGYGLNLLSTGDWRFSINSGETPYDAALSSEVIYAPPQQIAAGTIFRVPATAGASMTTPARCAGVRLYRNADASITVTRFVTIREMYVLTTNEYKTISTTAYAYPATVTTSAAHGLKVGDRVFIWGNSVAAFNGLWTVLTIPTTTSLTIACTATSNGTGGTVERMPSPVDAMKYIGETLSGATASINDSSYAAALPGTVAMRPHSSWAEGMDAFSQQFSEPQEWGWWDLGQYRQETVSVPASGFYEIDTDEPGNLVAVKSADEGQPDYVRVLYTLGHISGLGKMKLRVNYTYLSTAYTVELPVTLDGYVKSTDNSYATACAGTGTKTADSSGANLFVGQNKSTSPTYRLNEAFITVDVTSIPDTAVINSAYLSGVSKNKYEVDTDFYIYAYSGYDHLTSVDTGDWRTPTQLAALTKRGNVLSSNITVGRRFDFSDSAMSSYVTSCLASNLVKLCLASEMTEAAYAPTAAEYVSLWALEGDTVPDVLVGQVVETLVGASGLTEEPGYEPTSNRVEVLDLSATTMLTEDAQAAGAQYLEWYGRSALRGAATVLRPTIAVNAGSALPAPYVRAGEWAWDIATSSSRKMYISQAEYDVDSHRLSLTIGEDMGEFIARVTSLPEYKKPKKK